MWSMDVPCKLAVICTPTKYYGNAEWATHCKETLVGSRTREADGWLASLRLRLGCAHQDLNSSCLMNKFVCTGARSLDVLCLKLRNNSQLSLPPAGAGYEYRVETYKQNIY